MSEVGTQTARLATLCNALLIIVPQSPTVQIDWDTVGLTVGASSTDCRAAWKFLAYGCNLAEDNDDSGSDVDNTADLTAEKLLKRLERLVSERGHNFDILPPSGLKRPLGLTAEKQISRRPRKMWTPDEDEKLLRAVQSCGEGNWAAIRNVSGLDRKSSQLSQRWARLKSSILHVGGAATANSPTVLPHGLTGSPAQTTPPAFRLGSPNLQLPVGQLSSSSLHSMSASATTTGAAQPCPLASFGTQAQGTVATAAAAAAAVAAALAAVAPAPAAKAAAPLPSAAAATPQAAPPAQAPSAAAAAAAAAATAPTLPAPSPR